MKKKLVDLIMEYESGELPVKETLTLFSKLIKSGQCWSLQGHYGRIANALIKESYINKKGIILKELGE